MGNSIHTEGTPIDNQPEDPLSHPPTSHINKLKKKYVRLERDLFDIRSQMGYDKRKLIAKLDTIHELRERQKSALDVSKEQIEKHCKEVESALADIKRLNEELEASKRAEIEIETSWSNKFEHANLLRGFAENDKQLLQSRLIETENQLRIAKANNTQADKIFARKKKLHIKRQDDKVSSFFDNRDEHISALQEQTGGVSIPGNLRRSLITQTLNYAEERMFN